MGLDGLEDRCYTLPTTNTHGDQCILAACPMELIERLDSQDAACCPDGMTERDAAAIRIRAIHWQIQVLDDREGLSSKSLIEFDHIHIMDGQVGPFEGLFYRGNWSNTHVLRLYTGMGIGDKPSHRFQPASLGLARLHQHDRGSRIVDTRRITCSYTSPRLEGWTHL